MTELEEELLKELNWNCGCIIAKFSGDTNEQYFVPLERVKEIVKSIADDYISKKEMKTIAYDLNDYLHKDIVGRDYVKKRYHATYCHPTSGYPGDQKIANELLKLGKTYEIDKKIVHSFSTEVYLKNIPNIAFNSVLFDIAEAEYECPNYYKECVIESKPCEQECPKGGKHDWVIRKAQMRKPDRICMGINQGQDGYTENDNYLFVDDEFCSKCGINKPTLLALPDEIRDKPYTSDKEAHDVICDTVNQLRLYVKGQQKRIEALTSEINGIKEVKEER